MYPNEQNGATPTPPLPFQPEPAAVPPAPQPQFPPQPSAQPSYNPYSAAPQQPMPSPAPMPVSQPQPYVAPDFSQQPQPQPAPMAPAYGQPQPMGPSAYRQPSTIDKKLIMLIAGAVVAVGLIGTGVWLFVSSGGNPLASITGAADVQDRSDGTLDLSNLIDSQKTIKNQDVKAKIGQQVNLADGTSYMVTKVERNFVTSSKFLAAKTGKELIKVALVVGNRSKSSDSFVSSGLFQVKNSAGGLQDAEYATTDEVSDVFKGDDIAPGKQTTGSLIFEVDKDEVVSLATSQDYENFSSKQTVTIKSEVTLK